MGNGLNEPGENFIGTRVGENVKKLSGRNNRVTLSSEADPAINLRRCPDWNPECQ